MRWRAVVTAVLLVGFGLLRLPFETLLDVEQREAWFRGAKIEPGLREQVGQMGFLAAMGGFRSLLAAVLWIEAHTAWEKTEWGRMAALFQTVTTLQPRSLLYWDLAAWHMAWNAGTAALNNPGQPSEALRIRSQRQYLELGKDFLQRGIRNNPDRPVLYERLGQLLRDKFEDHCGAADAFLKAAEFPDARPYIPRFAAYEMAECPGREKEAYERLRSLYLQSHENHVPTLLTLLAELEEKLGIPMGERILGANGAESEKSAP